MAMKRRTTSKWWQLQYWLFLGMILVEFLSGFVDMLSILYMSLSLLSTAVFSFALVHSSFLHPWLCH
jgi:hypothetical protein